MLYSPQNISSVLEDWKTIFSSRLCCAFYKILNRDLTQWHAKYRIFGRQENRIEQLLSEETPVSGLCSAKIIAAFLGEGDRTFVTSGQLLIARVLNSAYSLITAIPDLADIRKQICRVNRRANLFINYLLMKIGHSEVSPNRQVEINHISLLSLYINIKDIYFSIISEIRPICEYTNN